MTPPICPLKINKDSCYIKKSQQRHHPVIIYTHSPKIIHTNPRDFMALVQKLTGLSSNPNTESNSKENHNSSCNARINPSSSSCCEPPNPSSSCCKPPIFYPTNASENGDRYSKNIHNDFGDSLDDLLCSYTDAFFYV